MAILKWLLVVLLVPVVLVFAAGRVGLLTGAPPADLGVRDGRLKPPSSTDNSVSSQAGLYPQAPQHGKAAIAPLALRGDGPATIARIRAIVADMDGATIVKSEPDYLYVQVATRWMRFVDDVEFWYDPGAQVIQVRSASRLGEQDLGTNRQRIEALRARLAAAP